MWKMPRGEGGLETHNKEKPDEGSADIGRGRGKRRRYLSDQEVEQDLTHF